MKIPVTCKSEVPKTLKARDTRPSQVSRRQNEAQLTYACLCLAADLLAQAQEVYALEYIYGEENIKSHHDGFHLHVEVRSLDSFDILRVTNAQTSFIDTKSCMSKIASSSGPLSCL